MPFAISIVYISRAKDYNIFLLALNQVRETIVSYFLILKSLIPDRRYSKFIENACMLYIHQALTKKPLKLSHIINSPCIIRKNSKHCKLRLLTLWIVVDHLQAN